MSGAELLIGLGCFLAGVLADRVCLRIQARRRSRIATEALQPKPARTSAQLAAQRLRLKPGECTDPAGHNFVNGGAFYICTRCNREADDLGRVIP